MATWAHLCAGKDTANLHNSEQARRWAAVIRQTHTHRQKIPATWKGVKISSR